jgi:hypothetical protein
VLLITALDTGYHTTTIATVTIFSRQKQATFGIIVSSVVVKIRLKGRRYFVGLLLTFTVTTTYSHSSFLLFFDLFPQFLTRHTRKSSEPAGSHHDVS